MSRFPFWYVSTNCGWSRNAVDCLGEAVQVIDLLESQGRRYNARLCDKSKDYLFELLCFLRAHGYPHRGDSTIKFYPTDNRKFIPLVTKEISSLENFCWAAGCIIVDPNGPSVEDAPYRELVRLVGSSKRLDLIVNINYGSMNRCRHCHHPRSGRKLDSGWIYHSVSEFFRLFPSRKPLVSGTISGLNKYVVVVLRDSVAYGHETYGLYRPKSTEGQEILSVVDGGSKQ